MKGLEEQARPLDFSKRELKHFKVSDSDLVLDRGYKQNISRKRKPEMESIKILQNLVKKNFAGLDR